MGKNRYSTADGYSIKKVTDLCEFDNLKAVWDTLAEKQGAPMPFLCFDWFKMWLEHFLGNNKLLVLLVYKGDQLVAVAPFFLLREKFKSISVKKIELIGNAYSPIRNFIFNGLNTEEKRKCILYTFDYLFKELSGWDIIDLYPLLEDDQSLNILRNIVCEKGYQNCFETYAENWYMDGINYSSDEYLNKRKTSKQFIYIAKRRRKLESSGRVEYRMVKSAEDIDRHMDDYYKVYERSWKKREGIGPTFHRDLARLAAAKGWLRLGFLYLNGAPVATHFCMVSTRVGYFLKVAYDEEYKEYGLGNVIHYETIKYMIDHDKIESIDLGAGSEDYKKFWVSDRREMKKVLIFGNSLKGNSLAFLINRVLPTMNKYESLKRIKASLMNRFGIDSQKK